MLELFRPWSCNWMQVGFYIHSGLYWHQCQISESKLCTCTFPSGCGELFKIIEWLGNQNCRLRWIQEAGEINLSFIFLHNLNTQSLVRHRQSPTFYYSTDSIGLICYGANFWKDKVSCSFNIWFFMPCFKQTWLAYANVNYMFDFFINVRHEL